MITLHILQYLHENGFGTIDEDLFFEKLPLGKSGVAIFSRGGGQSSGRASASQTFDLYSRGSSDMTGMDKLEKIRQLFAQSYGELCELPIVPDVSNRVYKNCRFVPIDNIENLGLDDEDRVIYRLGAQIIYQK